MSEAPVDVWHDEEVRLLRWPAEERERQRLAALGSPRLLVLDRGQPPPEVVDDLEDWAREPVDTVELLSRRLTLRQRALIRRERPILDDDGLLRHAGRWVAVPDGQLPALRHLLENLGRVVRFESLALVCANAGVSSTNASIKSLVFRLGRRCDDVGLRLETVRGRGIILRVAPA